MNRHSMIRRGTALAAASLTAAGAMVAAAPGAQAAPTRLTNNCDLGVTVSELAAESPEGSNIIVFREDKMASMSFDGITANGKIVDHGCEENSNRTYLWFVFDGNGEFIRQGDGGYRNWAWSGVWDRPADNVVHFQ